MSNIEQGIYNSEVQRRFDLENRLMELAVSIGRVVQRLPTDRIGAHVAGQLVRCCTAPAANYAEALGAESRRDFIHKMKLGLKELRESQTWLCYSQISTFVASIRTAKKNIE